MIPEMIVIPPHQGIATTGCVDSGNPIDTRYSGRRFPKVIASIGKPPALPERLPKFDFYGRLDKETAYWEIDCGLPPHLNPLPQGEEVIPCAGIADGIVKLEILDG